MPATYEPIATTTLGSSASSITFSSIPATYTDLRLVVVAQYSSENNLYIRFNNDSGTNYSGTAINGNGSTAASFRETNGTGIQIGRVPASSNFSLATCDIFSYAGSTYKTCLSTCAEDTNGGGYVYNFVNLYRSTSAINRIDIYFPGFNTGTTATIYGIKAA
jgi:hypothetical protein